MGFFFTKGVCCGCNSIVHTAVLYMSSAALCSARRERGTAANSVFHNLHGHLCIFSDENSFIKSTRCATKYTLCAVERNRCFLSPYFATWTTRVHKEKRDLAESSSSSSKKSVAAYFTGKNNIGTRDAVGVKMCMLHTLYSSVAEKKNMRILSNRYREFLILLQSLSPKEVDMGRGKKGSAE